ncbi:hypothetical protein VHEMI08212 [[Torrubiella] hemipterigena]|uniref:Zn(2)-C6 fungal-type domain-containing protein n=1 Tax=[Torrubiella] hemipterigena TaxID=1531966 RepID=A0A0A1TPA8_9HYPO|nr:hypothetical protein VHEMI08212 [[Torrubiella] hemipterigena]
MDTPKPHRPSRTCTLCRQRKVKCDRQRPCSQCIRAKLECTYPPGPGRAAKRSRNTSAFQAQVVDKLHNLEKVIKQFTAEREAALEGNDTFESSPIDMSIGATSSDMASPNVQVNGKPTAGSEPHNDDTPVEEQIGRLIVQDTKSHYISNILWSNLGNEIEELRDMLYEPISEDESCVQSKALISTPIKPMSSILCFFPEVSDPMRVQHPSLFQSVALLDLFSTNVLPLVHIFHMPTTSRLYWDAIASLNSLDRNTEALLFAIYYSAILSAEPETRESILGMPSNAALEMYRSAVEQAITRADLLNTRSILLLQAAVLFLSALRNEDDSRTAWSLIPLVLRIAQAMGLHRDGSMFGLKPLEIEVRRRLWYHICLLDMKSSEYHGFEPIVHEAKFDTKLPLNINDSDLNPQMIEPPPERDGPTEMTFCLIRCEAMRTAHKVGYAPPSLRIPGLADGGVLSIQDRESFVEDLSALFEDRYIKGFDSAQAFQHFYTVVARLIVARMRLVVLFPFGSKDNNGSNMSGASRDRLFSISMEALEFSYLLLTEERLAKWAWHGKTHVQWHTIAFILSEICSRPPSAECDRAWQCITKVLEGWEQRMDNQKGSHWGPVKCLMAKARYVREMQRRDPVSSIECNAAPNLILRSTTRDMRGGTQPLEQVDTIVTSMDNFIPSIGGPQGDFAIDTSRSYIEATLEELDVASLAAWWDTSINM